VIWCLGAILATADDFYQRVLDKNTLFYFNKDFEERYEAQQLNSLRLLLYNLYLAVQSDPPIKKRHLNDILQKHNGLRAVLSLNGFSNEFLKRITTMARILDDASLNKLLKRDDWSIDDEFDPSNISEWSDKTIIDHLVTNDAFRAGFVDLFFEGATNPCLIQYLPPFELVKLSSEKFNFEVPAFLDTVVRYKEKGSYTGKRENNPEDKLRQLLDDAKITYKSGVKLNRLMPLNDLSNRTMDLIIPDLDEPRVIVESSFLSTTSSSMGDKAKAMVSIKSRIRVLYPSALFIGFVDGIGWYVRKNDLDTMVSAFDDVFTFRRDELFRFELLLAKILKR